MFIVRGYGAVRVCDVDSDAVNKIPPCGDLKLYGVRCLCLSTVHFTVFGEMKLFAVL